MFKNPIRYEECKKIVLSRMKRDHNIKIKSNFLNLLHHNNEFGNDAEWHFFATSHGKGAYDGIGGCMKRSTYRASL